MMRLPDQSSPPISQASGTSSELPFKPTGQGEQDWVNMLMASPLFHQINEMHEMLERTTGGAGGLDRIIGKRWRWKMFDWNKFASNTDLKKTYVSGNISEKGVLPKFTMHIKYYTGAN